MKKALFWLVALAIYLNTGWAIGTYYHNHLRSDQEQTTVIQKVLVGPSGVLQASQKNSLLNNQLIDMVIWPFHLFLLLISWILYGIYLLLWLIFAGGIAKIMGVD